jgi:manganese-transporting P-type ATPase
VSLALSMHPDFIPYSVFPRHVTDCLILSPANPLSMKDVKSVPAHTTHVLATAHALVKLDDNISTAAELTSGKAAKSGDATVVGDPMEKTTLEALGWHLKTSDILEPAGGKNVPSVNIRRRYQFSSSLKRMSTISTIGKGGRTMVSGALINRVLDLLPFIKLLSRSR